MKINIKLIVLNVVLVVAIVSLLPPYPSDNSVIYDRTPIFRSFGKGTIVISRESDFSNQIIKEDFENIYKIRKELDFGTYYWKIIKENSETKTRKLIVESLVSASIKENKLVNEGNTIVSVLPKISGSAVFSLEPYESAYINHSEKEIYEIRQDE